jgi:hypothetical protein
MNISKKIKLIYHQALMLIVMSAEILRPQRNLLFQLIQNITAWSCNKSNNPHPKTRISKLKKKKKNGMKLQVMSWQLDVFPAWSFGEHQISSTRHMLQERESKHNSSWQNNVKAVALNVQFLSNLLAESVDKHWMIWTTS